MDIPGGWKIGMQVYFSHPNKPGLLGSRVVGTITEYIPESNQIILLYEGEHFKFEHTNDFGGISGYDPLTDSTSML